MIDGSRKVEGQFISSNELLNNFAYTSGSDKRAILVSYHRLSEVIPYSSEEWDVMVGPSDRNIVDRLKIIRE